MKIRSIVALVALPVLAVTLAGCFGQATPVHQKLTAAQKCSPATATIRWSQAYAGEMKVSARVTYLTRTSQAEQTAKSTYIAPKVTYTWDDELALDKYSTTALTTWNAALLDDLRNTGQVDPDFGGKYSLPPELTRLDKNGTALVDNEVAYAQVPFTVTCAGEKPFTGNVAGPTGGSEYTVIVGCDQKPAKHDSEETLTALALTDVYCVAS